MKKIILLLVAIATTVLMTGCNMSSTVPGVLPDGEYETPYGTTYDPYGPMNSPKTTMTPNPAGGTTRRSTMTASPSLSPTSTPGVKAPTVRNMTDKDMLPYID